MKTLNELRALAKAGKLNYLTLSEAVKLRGKHIETIYFGYAGQEELTGKLFAAATQTASYHS